LEVTVVAPLGSRLADELARELELSAFTVELRATSSQATPWPEDARRLLGARRSRVIAVRGDERQIVVFSRASSLADGVAATFDLGLESSDRPSRRRACLTVVEYLRALAAAGAAEDTARPGPPVDPQVTTAPVAQRAAPQGEPMGQGESGRAEPWMMGVGMTLDIAPPRDHPAAHLNFIWYFPIAERWRIQARADWPLLGVDLRSSTGDDIRMWTFGATVGLLHTFSRSPARLYPFVGLSVGNRMALTEVNSAPQPLQSRTAVTPSVTVSGQGGIRFPIHRRVQGLAAAELARDWMLPAANRPDYERAAANAFSLHISAGVLFEY
jgi:hypothetical protein